ncbi:MAG: helix-turn-helix domain-containing protein [Tannerella sp.]|jgi:transcriptional regulator with XRE-family HTH domain|nr:helix-turn-helix domain-containing protein [Tannerella sp.]
MININNLYRNNNLYHLNNIQILSELGNSLKRKRINSHLTQKDLAERAGVSEFTINGLERGRNVSLDTLISVLRQLNQLDLLNRFLQPDPIAPDVLLKLEKKKKQRVRKSKTDIK